MQKMVPKSEPHHPKNFPKKLNAFSQFRAIKNLTIFISKLFFYKIVNPQFCILPPNIVRPRLTRIPNTRAPHSTVFPHNDNQSTALNLSLTLTPIPQKQNWRRNNNKGRQLTHRNRASCTPAPQLR